MPELRPTARYRRGARDAEARAAHVDQDRAYRRSLAAAEFPPAEVAEFLSVLAQVGNVAATCRRIGRYRWQLVYGRMRWDTEFADAVEKVLTDVCRAGELCGRPGGAKRGGSCAACRAAKRAPRVLNRARGQARPST